MKLNLKTQKTNPLVSIMTVWKPKSNCNKTIMTHITLLKTNRQKQKSHYGCQFVLTWQLFQAVLT